MAQHNQGAYFDNPWLSLGLGLLSQPTMGQGLLSGIQLAQRAQEQGLLNRQRQQQMAAEQQRMALEQGRTQNINALSSALSTGPSNAPLLGEGPPTPQEMGGRYQGDIQGLLAKVAPEQVAQSLLAEPKSQELTGDVGQYMNARALGIIPKDMSFPDYLSTVKRPQTVVNVGENKILGSDAANWVDENGKKPPATMSISEAVASGFSPKTTEELKTSGEGRASTPILGSLADIAFGNKEGMKSIFPGDDENIADRLARAAKTQAGIATKSRSATREVLYESSKKAFLTQLARLSGQVGTLTDRDIGQVANLLPTAGFTPEGLAKDQFRQVAGLLSARGLSNKQLSDLGIPSWALEPINSMSGKVRRYNPETGRIE